MAQFNAKILINASTEEYARKKIVVLKNIADNVPDASFDTLLEKINKNPQFFKILVETKNPLKLVKMF